jgi:hypothetical protein
VSSEGWAVAGSCAVFSRLFPIISARPVGWRRRYVGFPAQARREIFDGGDVFVIFSFDYRANHSARVLICLRGCLFDRSNFLLTRLDVVRDSILDIHDVGRGASTPLTGIPKLLAVFLQRPRGPVDCGTS